MSGGDDRRARTSLRRWYSRCSTNTPFADMEGIYEQRQPAGGLAGPRMSLSRSGAGSEISAAVPAIVD
jgi:hypothetical protein